MSQIKSEKVPAHARTKTIMGYSARQYVRYARLRDTGKEETGGEDIVTGNDRARARASARETGYARGRGRETSWGPEGNVLLSKIMPAAEKVPTSHSTHEPPSGPRWYPCTSERGCALKIVYSTSFSQQRAYFNTQLSTHKPRVRCILEWQDHRCK